MRRLLLALAATLLFAAPAHAGDPCQVQRFTSNGTTSPILDLHFAPPPATAWLAITDAGGGTISVAVNIFGPLRGAVQPSALLCTMNATTTYCGLETSVEAMSATVTGCTTSCDITVSLCGSRYQ